jgi:putative ABC transport system substrate-binding protein
MRQLGWVDGQDVAYDQVHADNQQQLLPRLAAELVARNPEVIYAPPTQVAVAAKQATRTIPIVFAVVFDPVGIGLVTSLTRPGGNVTGIAFGESLAPKRLELLREILPAAKRLGLLADLGDSSAILDQHAISRLSGPLGLTIAAAQAANPAEFDAAVSKLIAARVDVIIEAGVSTLVGNLRRRVIDVRRVGVLAPSTQGKEGSPSRRSSTKCAVARWPRSLDADSGYVRPE